MGILQNIVNKVKEIYTKADTALGGYLPGGSTPAQVAASKTTSPAPAVSAPSTPMSLTGTYDKATSTFTSPTGQKQSMAPTAPAAQAARQTSSQQSVAQPVSTKSTVETQPVTAIQPVAPTTQSQSELAKQTGVRNITPTKISESQIPVVGANGDIVGYSDPKTQGTYFDQYGQFQYDLFSKEGITERFDRYLTKTGEGIEDIAGSPVTQSLALAAVQNPQLVSSLATQATNVVGFLANSAKIGALARTPAGIQTIAQASPQAAGIATKAVTKAGEVAINPKTSAASIGFLSKLSSSLGLKDTSLGTILKLGFTGATGISVKDYISGGNPEAVSKMNTFLNESDELQVKLREVGMDDLADELLDANRDLSDDFDSLIPYLPFAGTGIEKNKIEEYKRRLDEITIKYDKQVKAQFEAAKAEAEIKKAKEAEQKAIDDAEKLAESRRYAESQKQEERAYREEQERIKEEKATAEALGLDAISTESTGGSNLSFGLLSSGGAKEFVDKDKASRYYFGKVYEELSEAQKKLLNLLKEQRE